MKKIINVLTTVVSATVIFTGCLSSTPPAPYTAPPAATPTAAATAAATPATAATPAASTGQNTDAVTSASPKESSNPADIIKGLSSTGYWIFSVLSDVTLTEPINVDGKFHRNDDAATPPYRKFALYAQDADRKVTANYTVTVPQMNVTSPNFRIQQGTLKGNVFVNAEGFEIVKTTIDGNLTFATQAQMDSAKLTDGTVTGKVSVGAATDAVTSASPKESSNPADIIKGLSSSGYWIFSVLSDVTLTEPLNVDGKFHRNDDATTPAYRKFALYAQDADRKVTANYTVTVPQVNVTSPNFRIQQGTVKGNVHVNAEGFEIVKTTIDGNLTFETQAQMDSAKLTDGTVTGKVSVK